MMENLDDLNARAEKLITELSDIIQHLENDIDSSKKSISLRHIKEIEASIERIKKQNLAVPTELKALKIKLFSEYECNKERIALYQNIQERIGRLLTQAKPRQPNMAKKRLTEGTHQPTRNPLNNERPLGSRGYSNLEHYLIPVIKLMWDGMDHRKAFREIAQRLDVRYNTVGSQCTRALGLTTDEFVEKVTSKQILDHLENRYPDSHDVIESQLRRQL